VTVDVESGNSSVCVRVASATGNETLSEIHFRDGALAIDGHIFSLQVIFVENFSQIIFLESILPYSNH
jgi:hypothetical protein